MEVKWKTCSLMGLALVAADPVSPVWTQQRKAYMCAGSRKTSAKVFHLCLNVW